MDDRELLLARMAAARMDLEKAQAALEPYQTEAAEIASTLGSLNNRLAAHGADIGSLQQALADGQELTTSWRRFAGVAEAIRSTTSEVLALVQGGPLREREPGGGIYALADALVREVATDLGRPWAGITLPGEREQVTTRSSIIALTFPQVSVWDLPIVLHEYGHEVAPEIRNQLGLRPFEQMSRNAGSAVERAHLTELFADAFASYTCGPAFACTLVVLRFDPTAEEATRDLPTHPSHARRVALVLRVLEEQGEEIADSAWTALVKELREAWQSSLQASRRPENDDPPTAAPGSEPAPDAVSKLLAVLHLVPPHAAYQSWERARRLVSWLAGNRVEVSLKDGFTIRDALNAAWLARLRSPREWSDVGSRAEHLIGLIARRP